MRIYVQVSRDNIAEYLKWFGRLGKVLSHTYERLFSRLFSARAFIGRTGEKVVGFCAARKMDYRLLELAGIVVRHDQLGKGIGTYLSNVKACRPSPEFVEPALQSLRTLSPCTLHLYDP